MGDAALAGSLGTLFRGLIGVRTGKTAQLPPVSVLESDVAHLAECDCALPLPADYYFRVDLRNGELRVIPAPAEPAPASPGYAAAKVGSYAAAPIAMLPTPADGEKLITAIRGIRLSPAADYEVVFARVGDSLRAIGLAPQRDSAGAAIGAFGFVAVPGVYAATLISNLWRQPKILPVAITRGFPSDSLLTALITTPDGQEIYRSSGWSAGLLSDTASLAPLGGGMRVRVALRRDAVARLGGGLIPASRVPVWVGLLLLTGLLTAIILRNLQREHELTRLRADFTASVSHELRTPLAQIMLFGETLKLGRTRSEGERTRAAEVIVREARRLMQLVDNTLQFSRAERPGVGLSPERTRLAPAVHDAIAAFEPLAETRGVRITADVDDAVEALVDRSALRQMLINLLDNALKFGPREQTISVGLSSARPNVVLSSAMLAPHQSALQYVVHVTVDDEGPGISGRSREEIWAPFVRGPVEQDSTGGCGLGLAVVRELATRHGGRAWVEDTPGARGSRFVIELPAVAPERNGDDGRVDSVGARANEAPKVMA